MITSEVPVTIEQVFAGISFFEFIQRYLYRLPFALPGAASAVVHWGAWETLATVSNAPHADLMVVKANERHAGEVPADLEGLLNLSRQGYTILARHVERQHAGIAQLAEQFAATFQGPVDVHLYVTPPNQYGFSWHYDAEDVFVIQLAGEKEYHLRKNTVNPWPLVETLPQDMQYERELMPLMRVKLSPGDLLYIPGGYWHRAETTGSSETAFSLAIGVLPRTAMDVFDLLRPQLLESLLWRQRLPLKSTVDDPQVATDYEELLQSLADDLTKTLTSDKFKKKVMELHKS